MAVKHSVMGSKVTYYYQNPFVFQYVNNGLIMGDWLGLNQFNLKWLVDNAVRH